MSEFHDLSEVVLNTQGASWGNLGYWEAAVEYSDACRDLARQLGDAAGLREDSVVLDVGFGCGDQLLVWLKDYGVKSVCGINVSASQTLWAQARLSKEGYTSVSKNLFQGDVCGLGSWGNTSDYCVNRIVALDCVYHFPSSHRFFDLSYQQLVPGGLLSMTDFVLAEDVSVFSVKYRALLWMLKRSNIPLDNIRACDDYVQALESVGFSDVSLRDISHEVMPKFKVWLVSFKKLNGDKMPWYRWLKYDVTSSFLSWAYRKRVLRYVIVTASK